MARLMGIGVLLWAVYASLGFSIEHAPRPTDGGGGVNLAGGVSPVDALSEAEIVVEGMPPQPPRGRAFAAGAWAVGDSPSARIAARDRDNRPRERRFVAADRTTRDGQTNVEGEITPGLYATAFGTEDCGYELWRVMRDRETRIIGEEYLAEGRLLVTINGVEPDWFTSDENCGRWYEWTPQLVPLTSATNGDYWVGDLAAGLWSVPRSCRWEKVAGFRGAALHDVIDGGTGPSRFIVDEDTFGVRLRGCRSPITLFAADTGYDAP